MQIIHHLTMDMVRQLPMTPVGAVQNDANTRAVEMRLLENGTPWVIPQGITAAVAFRKGDGSRGLYDTLPGGSAAITTSGSTVTAILAPQVLTCPGTVSAAIVFFDGELNRLAAFPFAIRVESDPSAGQGISNDYYKYSTMEEISEAVEAALALLEEDKQEFLTEAKEALQVVQDMAAREASAIVCQETGDVVAVKDASDAPLRGLSLYGKTIQNGTPTPTSPVPLESAGESGVICVTVAGSNLNNDQTITVTTEGGLHGIGDVCDEIDFARGVRVQRIGKCTITSADVGTAIQDGVVQVMKPNDFRYQLGAPMLCNRFENCIAAAMDSIATAVYYLADGQFANRYWAGSTSRFLFFKHSAFKSLDAARAWFDANETTVLYILAEPIETPLSAEELASFAALHSHKPNTTAFNDGDAGLGIAYVADTKTYIDQKLAAISAAILNC